MRDRSGLLLNVVVAILGAFLVGYFLSPIFHVGTINDAIVIPTVLVTLLGAIILLAGGRHDRPPHRHPPVESTFMCHIARS